MKEQIIKKLIEYLPLIIQFIFTVIIIPVILNKFKKINFEKEIRKFSMASRQINEGLQKQNENLIRENNELKQILSKYISYSDDRFIAMKEDILKLEQSNEKQALKNVELEALARRMEHNGEDKKA